jgi:tetratricopeptide (TPR) repeat protein
MRSPFLRRIILLFAIYVLCVPVLAQRSQSGTGAPMRTSIRGTVRDAVTHRVLERVVLMIEDTQSGYAGQAETDSSGRFELQGLGATAYSINIRFPGYYEATQEVDLSTNPMAYLNFELRPKPGSAPPPVAPEGPEAYLNARLAAVPDKARKEFTKARELWQEGKDPQGCVDHLNKAVKIYPKFSDAYVLLASAYMRENKAADAKSALDKAIEVGPKVPEAWFTLGMLQSAQKDYAGAEKSLTEGLKLDDNAPQGHYELGKTYLALNRPDDAEQHAKKAAALQPNMAPVYILLGNIAWKKQDAAEALKEYQQYLKLDPKGPMAPGAQAMVKRIQDWFSQPQNSPQ